jgi:hypothetical protein
VLDYQNTTVLTSKRVSVAAEELSQRSSHLIQNGCFGKVSRFSNNSVEIKHNLPHFTADLSRIDLLIQAALLENIYRCHAHSELPSLGG